MKTIIKTLLVAVLLGGSVMAVSAQGKSGKLEVSTHLKETNGTYAQRQLYRKFLVEYMKNCPYISHFKVQQAAASSDNHDVVWLYQVNSWDDITKFYGWVTNQLKSRENNGLKMAMTPYQPIYAIGGQIQVQKKSKAALAKNQPKNQGEYYEPFLKK